MTTAAMIILCIIFAPLAAVLIGLAALLATAIIKDCVDVWRDS